MVSIENKPEREYFMDFLRECGFKGCPICGNADDFTWAHTASTPLGDAAISAFLPGSTTVPGEPSHYLEKFSTPLRMIICDQCTHLMLFSETMLKFKKSRGENAG